MIRIQNRPTDWQKFSAFEAFLIINMNLLISLISFLI